MEMNNRPTPPHSARRQSRTWVSPKQQLSAFYRRWRERQRGNWPGNCPYVRSVGHSPRNQARCTEGQQGQLHRLTNRYCRLARNPENLHSGGSYRGYGSSRSSTAGGGHRGSIPRKRFCLRKRRPRRHWRLIAWFLRSDRDFHGSNLSATGRCRSQIPVSTRPFQPSSLPGAKGQARKRRLTDARRNRGSQHIRPWRGP